MSGEARYCEIALEPKLASRAAPALFEKLRSHENDTVVLNASEVQQIGALAMQILVAASRDWLARGQHFEVVEPSGPFVESAKTLGIALPLVGVAEAGRE